MNRIRLAYKLAELAEFTADLERWADELRRQARIDLDDAILDLILELRPTPPPPIPLDTWLAADWPLPEVAVALGL